MKVLIVSMSALFIEALQIAICDRRPTWQVDTYPIQAPLFNQPPLKYLKKMLGIGEVLSKQNLKGITR